MDRRITENDIGKRIRYKSPSEITERIGSISNVHGEFIFVRFEGETKTQSIKERHIIEVL